jgi:hypothetical protein
MLEKVVRVLPWADVPSLVIGSSATQGDGQENCVLAVALPCGALSRFGNQTGHCSNR